ncbi:MAG: hypothetical protein H0X30_19790, partial [Anaerolineae bacterium]|nr:hypothetical protein [Anaerolineae bacterium]
MKLRPITFLTFLLLAFALALPVLAQDATTEATAQPDLQTFHSTNGLASVNFPADWVFKDNPDSDSLLSIKLSNNQTTIDRSLFNRDDVFKTGEVHIEVELIELTKLAKSLPEGTITPDSTPLEILQALAKQGMPDSFTFGEPGETTIAGNPAVRMNLTADKRGEGQIMFTILGKKWLAGILLFAAPGEGDKWDITARDILASITVDVKAEVTAEGTSQPTPESSTTTYTSQKGDFTIAYPSNLQFEDPSDGKLDNLSGGEFYSSATLKGKTPNDDFQSGDVYIQFALLTFNNYKTLFGDTQGFKPDASTSPGAMLTALIKATAVPALNYGIVTELPVSYGTVAQADVSGKGNNEGHVYLIKRDSDGLFIFLIIRTAPSELEKGEAAALSIAASLSHNSDQPVVESTAEPLALTQTAKTKNGLVSVSYPDKWLSRQFGEQSVYLSNAESALDKSFGSTLEAGQVNMLVTMSSTDDYIKQAQLPAKADATPLELLQLTVKAVGDSVKFGTPAATTVGDKQAARVDFKGEGFDGVAWLIEYQKGATIALQMLTAPGESAQWESVALSIAASI